MPEPAGSAPHPSGPRVGLALGSGSARGWAHLGVLHALKERGIRPAVVAGAAVGALGAAAYASDQRREPPRGSPTCSGVTASRRARRNSASSAR